MIKQPMDQTELLSLAGLIRDELISGDNHSAMRLTESVLDKDIPTRFLDLLGQNIAHPTAQTAPGAFLALLDSVAQTESPDAWPLIGSAIYAAFAHTMLPSAMQHARRHIARAALAEATDAIAARVSGQLLIDYFEEGLSQLYDWISDTSPWVRRALGVAVCVYVDRYPNEPGQIARLLQLMGLLFVEQNPVAIEGIGRGFGTIGKHQPRMLMYWLLEQEEIGKQSSQRMLHQAIAYLPDDLKIRFLNVE